MGDNVREREPLATEPATGFERYAVTLIVVSGDVPGDEHGILRPRWVIGSGEGADAVFDDPTMVAAHAAVEFHRGGFRLVALAPAEAPVGCNGQSVTQQELRHGDRIAVGNHVLQILIEKPDAAPIYRIDG
ncbi:MAG: FHA domain-containing protein [Myxococcota bacterium]